MYSNYTSAYIPDFKFTPEALEANRRGKLAAEQESLVENIIQTRRRDARRTAMWMLVFFGALMVIGFIAEYSNRKDSVEAFFQKQGIIFLVVILFLLFLIGISFFYSLWVEKDARARRIRIAEGEAQVLVKEASSRGGARYMRYELRIKRGMIGKLFRFGNAHSIEFFEPGQTYRVYYIDYYPFQIVLSAEKI